MTPPPAKPPTKPLTGPQKALRKLGLVRSIDLALHLPLRVNLIDPTTHHRVALLESVSREALLRFSGHHC